MTWFLIACGLCGVLLTVLSIGRAGIGWDAPIDIRAVAEVRSIPPDSSIEAAYEMVFWTSEFYGLLITQLAEGAHAFITGSSLSLDASNLATYRWVAGVTLTLATVGAAALSLALAQATRSSLAGAFTWALIMTTPLWIGMSHVNFKDVPVATGLSMLSAGVIFSRVGSSPLIRWFGGTTLLTIGAIVALGARIAAWPLILAILVGSCVVFAVADSRQRGWKPLLPTLIGSVVALFISLLTIRLTNPFAQLDLMRWLVDSVVVMREYPIDLVVKVAGQDFATGSLPWWYLPAWLGAQLPVLTSVALLWGLVAILASLIRLRWALPRGVLIRVSPVLIQGLVLPIGILLAGSVIYDGLRHVLFMIPALASIAGIGIATLDRATLPRPKIMQGAAAAITVAVVGTSLWASIRWLPYSYAFINPIAGGLHSERAWELDYWGVTGMEGVRQLRDQGLNVVTVEPSLNTTELIGSVWPDQARDQAPEGFGLYVFKRWDSSIGNCTPLFTIERDGQILGEGAKCTSLDR